MRTYTPEDVTLRVTAGTSLASSRDLEVPVNAPTPVRLSSDLIDVDLCVRIKDFHGLPRDSPTTSPYFDEDVPKTNGYLYSIAFRFTLKEPPSPPPARSGNGESAITEDETDDGKKSREGRNDDSNTAAERTEAAAAKPRGVKATDLQWGNYFERPVRTHLPPGINSALRIAKWLIDPGLDGDIYADKPFLYGPAFSSLNAVRVGRGTVDESRGGLVVEEGADDDGAWQRRRATGVPDDGTERMRWALRRGWDGSLGMDAWVWEYGTTYAVDFGNGYVDFSGFSLRLPGFGLNVLRVWDGQPFTYVLRARDTDEVYLAVVFDLLVDEEIDEDGKYRTGVAVRKGARSDEGVGEEEEAEAEAEVEAEAEEVEALVEGVEVSEEDAGAEVPGRMQKLEVGDEGKKEPETSIDDVD